MTLPLFWTKNFTEYQKCEQIQITSSNKRKFLVNYVNNDEILRIPGRLTFGGFFPTDSKTIKSSEFSEILVRFFSESLLGVPMEWKLPPDYFYPRIFKAQYQNLAPTIHSEVVDLNQHVLIKNWHFEMLSKGNRKKFRQAHNSNLIYHQGSIDDVSKCYQVLSANRSAKGVKVSMTETEMQTALRIFPDFYRIHFLEKSGHVAAMCLTVDIAPKIRYVLYWADNLEFRGISPLVFLFERLVTFCKLDKVEVLDLGISSVNGEINDGLFNFKRNLGALSSSKKSILIPTSLI